MNAQTILSEVNRRYQACKSYQDRGLVLSSRPKKELPSEIIFATYFRRPDRFRFEWTTQSPYAPLRHRKTHRVVWSEGSSTFLYGRDQTVKPIESLPMALAGATGVSRGASHTIPLLLLPEVGGFRLDQLEAMTLTKGAFEGVDCHLIAGRHPQGIDYEILLGVQDFLIRRVRETDREGYITDEVRRDIRVDEPIHDEAFAFEDIGSQEKPKD